MQFYLFLTSPKVAQLTPLSNYPWAGLSPWQQVRLVSYWGSSLAQVKMQLRVLPAYLLLQSRLSCCCSYCLCLCSVSASASACAALLGCCYCCGGHYFLYLIALLSAAVFCYICCNMHERTTIMYFGQAGQAPEPHTAPHQAQAEVGFLFGAALSPRDPGGGDCGAIK